MFLRDLIKDEKKIFHWEVYNCKAELIAKTNKQTLVKLCKIDKEFNKQVDFVVKDEADSSIKVNLTI